MARIPEEVINRIKREIPLADLCREYGIELKPKGKDLFALCPFHTEDKPSFSVTPSKNLWNCLGACGQGGDNIQLVMKCEKLSFNWAANKLAVRLGAAPPVTATIKTRMGTEHPALIDPAQQAGDKEVLAQVVDFYHQTFFNQSAAMQYLEKRGVFHPEAVKKFKIGYANRTLGYRVPSSTSHGQKQKEQLQRVGILRESGHEHLSGCVVFPVFNDQGEVSEIYGRRITKTSREAAPHLYLPGPHRGVWNRQSLVLADALAASPVREWILCESIIDALSFWVHGWHNVTASYGANGFTPDHWKLLRETRPARIYLAQDNDEAGNRAANELAQQLEAEGVEAWRVELPPGRDINDMVRNNREAQGTLAGLLAAAMRLLPPNVVPSTATPKAVQQSEPPLEKQPPLPLAADPIPAPVTEALAESLPGQSEFTFSSRQWRIRGLEKNTTFDLLKVTVRLEVSGKYHFDTFDLYQAKNRSAFILAAAQATGSRPEDVEGDLSQILARLEEHQDKRLIKKMAAGSKLPEVSLTVEEEREALGVLESPRLLERVLSDAHKCGLVGEETNILTAWLVSVSRKLDKPLGVCVMSRSAAGKSSLLEAVARFVPEEDRHQYTALTPQALFHMPENELRHKALFIAEDEGADGASYSLKNIQSDGQLVIACTMKDEDTGQMVTKTKTVKGPIALFFTSTSRAIDSELLNRLLLLAVDESLEQTRRIHDYQRQAQTLEGIIERRARPRIIKVQQNIQRLIRPLLVRNPFARELHFGSGQLRARRDHQKYLELINVMALVHQYQRKVHSAVDGDGQTFQYIEVIREDIARVDSLMKEIMAQTAEELTPQSKRMLSILQQMAQELPLKNGVKCQGPHRWTRREIRERTGWSDTQVRLVMAQLVDLEYVYQLGGGQGKKTLYQLADEPGESATGTPP